MDIQPIHGHPALRIDDAIIIADLHIGVEGHLGSKGFHLPSRTNVMKEDLLDIADDASRLIVLGDVKDSVPGSNKQEYREIPDFFQAMLEHFNVVDVVIGNHDTQIEGFLPKHVNIHPASGLRIGGIGMVHGHTWPSPDVMASEMLIIAHNHPTVMLMDGMGRRATEPCWFRAPFRESVANYIEHPKEMIMMPSFNRLLGGAPVNVTEERFLGPLVNSEIVDIEEARIFLLDGVCLGKRKDLLVKGKYKD